MQNSLGAYYVGLLITGLGLFMTQKMQMIPFGVGFAVELFGAGIFIFYLFYDFWKIFSKR
jgi:hypothetical protein